MFQAPYAYNRPSLTVCVVVGDLTLSWDGVVRNLWLNQTFNLSNLANNWQLRNGHSFNFLNPWFRWLIASILTQQFPILRIFHPVHQASGNMGNFTPWFITN